MFSLSAKQLIIENCRLFNTKVVLLKILYQIHHSSIHIKRKRLKVAPLFTDPHCTLEARVERIEGNYSVEFAVLELLLVGR